ncbi:MAG: 3-methyl-2-oxobutanoate dehydrogenase subunit VorB [Kiritimatiellae bacterium]|nr:3-methyl-2-oxobutanoate dehydrogenase subunit VorB [Kiritimatiellia bacterium]
MSQRVLMNGNEAIAEGAIRGGCDCYFGYPITPQNELIAYMSKHMPRLGRVFVQAESEVAAINMVYGAAAAGMRTMTSSSSPGISLKQEGISYIAGARLPMVIVNVQRGGPGLGSIDPSQADYFQAVKGGGHGDYRLIVLAPGNVQEMHDFTAMAFDLADKYRVPVMILADGRLGQMMEPLELWEKDAVRPEKEWALTGAKGRKQNIIRSYFSVEGVLEKNNIEIQENLRVIEENEVRYDSFMMDDAEIMLIGYGTSARLSKAVVKKCREDGIAAGLFRPISLWPFPTKAIQQYAKQLKNVLVVEMNAGQMVEDVRLAINGQVPVSFYGRMGGSVPTTEAIRGKLDEIIG